MMQYTLLSASAFFAPAPAVRFPSCLVPSSLGRPGHCNSQQLMHPSLPAAAQAIPVRDGCKLRAPNTRMGVDLAASYLGALHEHYFTTTATQALVLVSSGDILAQMIELHASVPREDGSGNAGDGDRAPNLQAGVEAPETTKGYDPSRTVRMGLLGMLIGGFGTARWLQLLEQVLPADAAAGYPGYSAFGNLPTWMYAPLLRLFGDMGFLDLNTVASADLVLIKAGLDACFWAPIANTAYLVFTPLLEGENVANVRGIVKERFVPVMQTELATFFPYNLLSFSLVPPLVRPFSTGFISMCFAVYISWITHLAAPNANDSPPAAKPAASWRYEPDAEPDAATARQVPDRGAAGLMDEVAETGGGSLLPAGVKLANIELGQACALPRIMLADREVRLVVGQPNLDRGAPIVESDEPSAVGAWARL